MEVVAICCFIMMRFSPLTPPPSLRCLHVSFTRKIPGTNSTSEYVGWKLGFYLGFWPYRFGFFVEPYAGSPIDCCVVACCCVASCGPSLPSRGEKPLCHLIHSLVDGLGGDFDGCGWWINAVDTTAGRGDIGEGVGAVWAVICRLPAMVGLVHVSISLAKMARKKCWVQKS